MSDCKNCGHDHEKVVTDFMKRFESGEFNSYEEALAAFNRELDETVLIGKPGSLKNPIQADGKIKPLRSHDVVKEDLGILIGTGFGKAQISFKKVDDSLDELFEEFENTRYAPSINAGRILDAIESEVEIALDELRELKTKLESMV